MYICIHVTMYLCIYVHVHMYVCMNVRIYKPNSPFGSLGSIFTVAMPTDLKIAPPLTDVKRILNSSENSDAESSNT